MGERFVRIEKATGSIPVTSTMMYQCKYCDKSFESSEKPLHSRCVDCRWNLPTDDDEHFFQATQIEVKPMMDTKSLASFVTGGGFVGLLAFVILSGSQGYWVYGSQYADAKIDRDQWKALAINATRAGEKLSPTISVMGADRPPFAPAPLGTSPQDIAERVQNLQKKAENKTQLDNLFYRGAN